MKQMMRVLATNELVEFMGTVGLAVGKSRSSGRDLMASRCCLYRCKNKRGLIVKYRCNEVVLIHC